VTSFENKCKVIAELWSFDRDGEQTFSELWEDYDLSTPIAHALYNGWVLDISEQAERNIEDLFDSILEQLSLADTGFESYRDLL